MLRIFVPFLLLLLFLTNPVHAQIVINEIQASNSETIFDDDGDAGDWIELYNSGSESVDLTGYGLSDDEEEPFRWVMPS
ncbi:MAG: lamin tail domain-containing protein, partial [Balneolaceae bacterium]